MIPHYSAYWPLVSDCLCEFHHFAPVDAQSAIRDFRLRLGNRTENAPADLVYHQEPFYLAAQLAGHEIREPSAEEAVRYEALLQRRVKEVSALGTDAEVAAFAKGGKAA